MLRARIIAASGWGNPSRVMEEAEQGLHAFLATLPAGCDVRIAVAISGSAVYEPGEGADVYHVYTATVTWDEP